MPWRSLLLSNGKGQFHPDSDCPDWGVCGALAADARVERWVSMKKVFESRWREKFKLNSELIRGLLPGSTPEDQIALIASSYPKGVQTKEDKS